MPDEQSAVVYFVGSGCVVWDGETPIGESGMSFVNMAWKTTPGPHYFMANAFNWVVMRADLEPNKHYFVQLKQIPNPVPFSTKSFIAMDVLEPLAGEMFLKQGKTIYFTDAWRAGYAQGNRLQEAREHLQKAQNKPMDIDLSGIHGR